MLNLKNKYFFLSLSGYCGFNFSSFILILYFFRTNFKNIVLRSEEVIHTFNLSTQEAEVDGCLQVGGLWDLYIGTFNSGKTTQ